MDWERDDTRRQLALCRVAFGLVAIGLGLLFIDGAAGLALRFSHEPEISKVLHSRWWSWLIGTPITWTTLIGAYLLWSAHADPLWKRQAGILVILNFIDFLSWGLSHADDLGFKVGDLGDYWWMRFHLTQATGWIEFLLFANLAAETAHRLNKADSNEIGTGARTVSMIGTVFWAIAFISLSNWHRGWPLQPLPMRRAEFALMDLGSTLLLTIASFQVTSLCLMASRFCAQTIKHMARDDQSEELLRSRSETFGDDPRDWFSGPGGGDGF